MCSPLGNGPFLMASALTVADGSMILELPKGTFFDRWTLVETKTEHGIYFTDRRSIPPSIKFLDLTSGEVRRIVEIDKDSVGRISVSPDGQWLLYCQVEMAAADIMLVENFR
jgi:hypothetical protein